MPERDGAIRYGSTQYADVLQSLAQAGLAAHFTQTGGMSAAIEVRLEGGWTLLATEAEDSLAWERVDHAGWGVGLYPPGSEYDEGPEVFEATYDGSVDSLITLVRLALQHRR